MFGSITLDINGSDGGPVPHWLLPAESETAHLAVLLPGRAYGLELPLLFYPAKLLHAAGADVLGIDYTSYTASADVTEEKINRRLAIDVPAVLGAALGRRSYQRITLLGKSLGTIVMGHLITADPRLRGADCIWMTPLLGRESLRGQIAGTPHRALFIIGTADEHFHSHHLADLEKATGGRSLVLEGTNHILEYPGRVVDSIQALGQVMGAIEKFLSGDS